MSAKNGRDDRVLKVITDQGVTSNQVALKLGMAHATVQKAIANLCAKGSVHRAKVSHKSVWYFLTKEAAEAFHRPVVEARPAVVIPPRVRTGFDRAAQVHMPDHVKVQKCPGFQGLGFAEPAKPENSPFASLGVGRYLTEETA